MHSKHPEKPRVLIVHNFLTPYREPLFAALARRFDLEVWILGDVRTIREWDSAPGLPFTCRMLPHISIPLGSRDYRLLYNPGLIRRLREGRWDAIIVCGWDTPAALQTAIWARRNAVPLVLWSGSTAGEPNWRRTLFAPIVRRHVQAASAWIAYGTRARDYLVSLGAKEERIRLTYNAIDTETFGQAAATLAPQHAELRQACGVHTPFAILYAGQLIPRKGLQDLLRALAILQREDITLVVAGSGPGESQCRDLGDALGISVYVRYAGFVSRTDLPRYYAMADLMALPSREEVWGLVINEALACGTPVLTTEAAGAAPDLIQPGVNGYAVPPANPEAIADALARHFSPGADRDAMSEAARRSIAPHTIKRAAGAFEEAVRLAMEAP